MSAADSLDVPYPFEYTDKGRLWSLRVEPRTFEMEFQIQRHIEENALKVVQRHREVLDAASYALNMDGWRRDCAVGVYEFGGEYWWRFVTSRSGWVYNAWLQLKGSAEGVTLALVERVYNDPEKMRELDAKMGLANDPNRKGAAPPAGDRPRDDSPSSTSPPTSAANPSAIAAAAS